MRCGASRAHSQPNLDTHYTIVSPFTVPEGATLLKVNGKKIEKESTFFDDYRYKLFGYAVNAKATRSYTFGFEESKLGIEFKFQSAYDQNVLLISKVNKELAPSISKLPKRGEAKSTSEASSTSKASSKNEPLHEEADDKKPATGLKPEEGAIVTKVRGVLQTT